MRVYGEAFLFINWWVDFLCLLLAARLGRCRFDVGKALISSGFGGMYGVIAWTVEIPALRSVPVLLLACLGMAFIAFGKRAPRLSPIVFASGCLLSGLSEFVTAHGASPACVIWAGGGAVLCVFFLTRRIGSAEGGRYRLRIIYRRKTAVLPALRDTGNLLTDGVSSLPVIVLPQTLAKPFLPPGTRVNDLSTLPLGFRLVRAKTAAGSRTLMCFSPDQIVIREGKRAWHTEAVIAVSDFDESRALLPDSLFSGPREGMCHAVL